MMDLLLTTSRLFLRPPTQDDAQGIFDAYASDPEAAKYMVFTAHKSVKESEEYVERCQDELRSGKCIAWAIFLRETGTLIGVTDLRIEGDTGEIGFAIGQPWWGQEYVPEAARAVLEFARDAVKLKSVFGLCDYENERSARVFEKLSFRSLGIKKRAVVHPAFGPEPRDARAFEIDLALLQ